MMAYIKAIPLYQGYYLEREGHVWSTRQSWRQLKPNRGIVYLADDKSQPHAVPINFLMRDLFELRRCHLCLAWKPLEDYRPGKGKCRPCYTAEAREQQSLYVAQNYERVRMVSRQQARRRRWLNKEQVIAHYGGACFCCKETRLEFLQLDHINDDGARHRNAIKLTGGYKFYAWIVRNQYPDGFQIACANCNLSRHIYGGCPHTNMAWHLGNNPNGMTRRQRYDHTFRQKLRTAVFLHYGGVCACCHESCLGFLAIDHLKGNGNGQRRHLGNNGGVNFYQWLKCQGFPRGYRVLCHNCNSALGFFGYCPHRGLGKQLSLL